MIENIMMDAVIRISKKTLIGLLFTKVLIDGGIVYGVHKASYKKGYNDANIEALYANDNLD